MRSKGRLQTRAMLLERIWSMNFDPTTSVCMVPGFDRLDFG